MTITRSPLAFLFYIMSQTVSQRAWIAQSVEHQTFNLRVQGSSPCSGAKALFCFHYLLKNYLDNSPFKNAFESEEALTAKSSKVTALKQFTVQFFINFPFLILTKALPQVSKKNQKRASFKSNKLETDLEVSHLKVPLK